MKRKYFMRGLGAGIVLSAVVSAVAVSQSRMTDEEVCNRARQLGMVEQENKKEQPEKKPEEVSKAAISAMPKEEQTTEPTALPEKVVTATPKEQKHSFVAGETNTKETKVPVTTKEVETTKKPVVTKKPQSSQKKYLSVTIEAGMWSNQISHKFQELGLVDDAEKFDDFLCDNGYASMIKVGVYQIPTNATYKEIASIITE